MTLCLYFYVTLLTQRCKENDTQALSFSYFKHDFSYFKKFLSVILQDNFRIEFYLLIIDSIIDDFLKDLTESMQLFHLV